MGVVTATELRHLAGRQPSSSNLPASSPALTDEEALSTQYIPADGLSACLITPHRILVTAGAAADLRVLPFSVVRYLDVSPLAWTKPVHLRRRRGSTDIPVPRVGHSLTFVPADARLYLFGGMKIDPDLGDVCKTIFAFDTKTRAWQRVDPARARVKTENDRFPGPRYAHSAVYALIKERSARPNSRAKGSPSLIVYGGYASHNDHAPRGDVHVLTIRSCRWAVCPVDEAALSPRRANHAAAVTSSQRYMVVHGGNYSDDSDSSVISDELFVFDLHASLWAVPERHVSSVAPPTARRRHSLVNGVGRHDGWLIMYGGNYGDDKYSNDMYMCRIIEPIGSASAREKVAVVWERIDVRGSIERPIKDNVKNTRKNRTVAGGCLVPIPKLNKYILLGGECESGLRDVPLLLDPYESDEIAISHSLPAELEEEAELAPIGERAAALNGEDNPPAARSNVSDDDDVSDDGEDIVFDLQKNTMKVISTQNPHRARSAISTPQGEQVKSARATPSVSETESQKSPKPSQPPSRSGNGDSRSRPTTNVHGAVAVKLRVRSAEKTKMVSCSPGDKDFMSGRKKRPRRRGGHNEEENATPPTKRGRFLAPKETDGIRVMDLDDHSGAENLEESDDGNKLPSEHSEFVSASELARKGKKAGRGPGRGRGRADGALSTRARSADDREQDRRRQELEKLYNQKIERIGYLEAENQDLGKQLSDAKNDNHLLNEQQKQLFEEIRLSRIRENARMNNLPLAAVPAAQARKPNANSQGSIIENNGAPSSRATEAKSFQEKIAELQAELTKRTAEKDEMATNVHDLEEEKRDVQRELFMMKNKIERTVVDRDSYHQEMKDLRKELVVVKREREAAEKSAQQAKENLSFKDLDVERLKADVKMEQQRFQDGKVELSSSDRLVRTLRDQLVDATKRSDEAQSREKVMKDRLLEADRRNAALQEQVNVANAKNRKLADEKIEVSAELESVRIELNQRIKECSSTLRDAEKSREALRRERLKRVNDDAREDIIRMKAEVDRTRKECSILRAKCDQYIKVRDLLPQIRSISEVVSAVFASDKETEDVDNVLTQRLGGNEMNGVIEQDENEKQDAQPEANAEPVIQESPEKETKAPTAQGAAEDPEVIPESDDADEP